MSGLEAAAAVATVIGIVASPLFQTFYDSLKNHLRKRFSKDLILPQTPLLPSEVRALEDSMGNIQLFLQLSQSIEARIGDLPKTLTQLRKAAYAAEDLLDELDYQDLQLKILDASINCAAAVQPSTGAGSSSSSKVGCFAPLKMFFTECFAQPSRLQLSPQPHSSSMVTAERIRSTVEDLNRVSSLIKDAYPLVMHTTGRGKDKGPAVVTGPSVTTSTVNSSKVYGRDEKKKEIMDILEIHDNEPRVSIIGIVGVGGMGKTTLAQYVFNDEKLKTIFDFKVWICVSDEYIKEKILREVIMDTASSRKDTSIEMLSITSMDTLEGMLKDKVENKKLLLVFDDVWSYQWTEILLPLQNIVQLCKIIVTTREKKNVMLPVEVDDHCKIKILELEGLDDAVYRSLFDEHAFGTQGPSGHPKGAMLQPIGWEIAKKLKGSPLAAKTVGAVLRVRLEVYHWRRIQDSDLCSIENQKSGDIMPALMLSYLHLPTCLQRCFSYCAIFLKDYRIQKEDLVNMWIAESYVSCSRRDERPEDVGLQHFEDLVSRSFFTKDWLGYYNMHDLLHDLALFVSLKEYCVYHSGNWHGDPETCHHLSITESKNLPGNLTEHLLESVNLQLEHVRTLIIDDFEKASEILKSMKMVRVVKVLDYTENEAILHDIGHLIHLRYLDLSATKISNVPESMCTLYHLQTLLFNPDVEIKFPERMCNLVSLRHLVADSFSIATIPFVGKLSRLQKLEKFNCECNNVGQLKEMNELGGELHIMNMERVESTHDAENARLHEKRRIKVLKLDWEYYTEPAEHHDAVLECLCPNEQLEELEITSHPGYKPPSWISPSSLTYIQRISLINCSYQCNFTGIAKLPYLEYLQMDNTSLVLELCDDDTFTSLVELKLWHVSLSFKMSQVHGTLFPKLQTMSFMNCEKLEGLTRPSSLKDLYIENSDVELPSFLKGLSSLTSLGITNQDRFTSFDKEAIDSLSSLEDLSMEGMRLVIELGDKDVFPSLMQMNLRDVSLSIKKSQVHEMMFPKLQRMQLKFCNKLEGLTMPSSLEDLYIENSDVELPTFLKGLSSITSLTITNHDRFTSFDGEVIDNLSSLEYLSMEGMRLVIEYGVEDAFPSLEEMNLRYVSLSFKKGHVHGIMFPRLQKMNLIDCQKLEGLTFPSSLKSLYIKKSDVELPTYLKGLSSLTYLEIENQDRFTSFDREVMDSLSSLEYIFIWNCNNFRLLPEGGFPTSLKKLIVYKCSPELHDKLEDQESPEWFMVQRISDWEVIR